MDYVYTDPIDDPDWPEITAPTAADLNPVVVSGWGATPTPRDQAAIDAGNA